MDTSTLGLYAFLGLAVLAMADITAILFAGRHRTWGDRIGWVLLGIFLLIAAISLAGCGPRRIIVYPIKGCDYWVGPGHDYTMYAKGPHNMQWPYGVKRCYPDTHDPRLSGH